MPRTILVTGGAGFVGSSLALQLKTLHPGDRVVAFDSLHRRGSELNIPRLRHGDVELVHGDVRIADDLAAFSERVDVILECSAEPSVLAGHTTSPRYAIDSNLVGCINCLELARSSGATFVFVSTSRVYPTESLRNLAYAIGDQRFQLLDDQPTMGATARGISEDFPLVGARSLYGATKLAAELLITEYVDMFGLRAVINRCGVISGPWQMGHSEQGVFAHWMMAHVLGRSLTYIGFGGTGQQVRDVLHVADLGELIDRQLADPDTLDGRVYNVGGGLANSVSLAEFSTVCANVTDRSLPIGSLDDTRPGDIPIYITDNGRVTAEYGWRPRRSVSDIAGDLHTWIVDNRDVLEATLA